MNKHYNTVYYYYSITLSLGRLIMLLIGWFESYRDYYNVVFSRHQSMCSPCLISSTGINFVNQFWGNLVYYSNKIDTRVRGSNMGQIKYLYPPPPYSADTK
jgi:hypothetical protein